MPLPVIKRTAAAGTNRDGREFVWTTTLPLQKDSAHDLYHDDGERV